MTATKDNMVLSLLNLARIALTGRTQDVQLVLHQASKRLKSTHPDVSTELIKLLQESPTRSTPLRRQFDSPLPVDIDSRLQLLRLDESEISEEPILPEKMQSALHQVFSERKNVHSLMKHGLHPTKSLLFTGPPGVGKTMTAKWIAQKLGRPLVVLDLAAVMSSFLGRTGNNIRFVLDYAKQTECVLLLDELDAIAKRRDDQTEIGELKRLVTVLLQEIDDWPPTGLLIAATNHPGLLDPAIWRRFEIILNFEAPTPVQIEKLVIRLLSQELRDKAVIWSKVLAFAFNGKSFSDIERQLTIVRKSAAISGQSLEMKLNSMLIDVADLNHEQRIEFACALVEGEILTQRAAHDLTGISRDTIRKHMKSENQ
ncbi:MAG: AAA family ATPase [Saprospiraceae bacterium]|nr:AAA family ATPase [Candidatus Opimibacter iunctus]